ncbi:sulfurtransferase TusA family protein [Swingsia samuiensis]|uniref:Sulfurtransferase TusA family protein n=1 Tax=Swingsia samuiensis TaxID=1293412 RepID=A0A4Y6UK32_9PROT|nr:sulfurtransferase TusA family protein [Swingsia samuiensis]QDH16365.1 sulfurtransferase TusA family protein [Swingsia samuiensis]
MSDLKETFLDLKGLICPIPVLKTNRALRDIESGDRLRVLTTDRASVADFQSFCRETGHSLIAFTENSGVFSFIIRKK